MAKKKKKAKLKSKDYVALANYINGQENPEEV